MPPAATPSAFANVEAFDIATAESILSELMRF
jgi:hypothetical protein